MPKEQQSLLMAHFNPEVIKMLSRIEQESNVDVEKLDWTPFYQSWPEIQKILNECKKEIKSQKTQKYAEEQRPKLKEYIMSKVGKRGRGAPVFLSQEVTGVIDQFLTDLEKS